MCGGTSEPLVKAQTGEGLSPRVRGNPLLIAAFISGSRSIPACAGEPRVAFGWIRWGWVYPRVCGGTSLIIRRRQRHRGLSPRVRGNPPRLFQLPSRPGSIPACAGEPGLVQPDSTGWWVYPRVCGGTPAVGSAPAGLQGLSPRVRGNLTASGAYLDEVGSIPACAGEPWNAVPDCGGRSVYPRVCGGTAIRSGSAPAAGGSIPACAGEPRHRDRSLHDAGVYPRVCGGT